MFSLREVNFMKKSAIFYSYLIVILLIVCIFVSCGGGSNNGTLPGTTTNSNIDSSNPSSVNSTPTPVLIQKPIQGYIYSCNTITEDGEAVPCINILDVPALQSDMSGNESFIAQVSNNLKQDYPEDWAKAEVRRETV